MARTLGSHRALLLNWFRARGQLAMGAVEGWNKARVTTKLAYGFRSYELGRQARPSEIVAHMQMGRAEIPFQP